MNNIKRQIHNQTRSYVRGQLGLKTWKETSREVIGQIWEQVKRPLSRQVKVQVHNQVWWLIQEQTEDISNE